MAWTKVERAEDAGFLEGTGFLSGTGFLQTDFIWVNRDKPTESWTKQSEATDTWTSVTKAS